MSNSTQFTLATALLLGSLSACASLPSLPQENRVGLDLQAYPNGTITSLTVEGQLEDGRHALALHVGYNNTDRGNDGEQDDETGGGAGFGVSGRHYFGEDYNGWFAGGRLDLWFLDIDWKQNPGANNEARGNTDVTVLQPTFLGGYRWKLGESPWTFEVYGSAGMEINIDTCGRDVGEGAIGLLGLGLFYKL